MHARAIRLLRSLLLGGLLIVLVSWGLLALMVSHTPAAPVDPAVATADLQAARRMVQRGPLQQAFHGQATPFTLAQHHLDTLTRDLARRVLAAGARVRLDQGLATIDLSLPAARTPLHHLPLPGSWLNIRLQVRSTGSGVPELDAVSVGSIPVPSALALALARRGAQARGLLAPTELALASVRSVHIQPGQAQVVLQWSPALSQRAFALVLPPEDHPALRHYHQQLGQLLRTVAPNRWWHQAPVPLSGVLQPMFESARQRTLTAGLHLRDGETLADIAARENRALLLAVALHASGITPGRFIPGADPWPVLAPRLPELHGRSDFAQHYLLSALVSPHAGGRLTEVAGLYKELLDATPGSKGSGFSFNDIAADLAGSRFGLRALKLDPLGAQERGAQAGTDADYMPTVADLPQYLSDAELRQRYGGIGSPAYNQLIQQIERRVLALPVLR